VVYVYAGLAKLNGDWLLYAQPLNLWMNARTHLPVIGPWLGELWVAYALSWAGFLYDTCVPFFLLHRVTRPFAFLAVLAFHAMTFVFFEIGMFPFIMTAAATLFFSPDWPRRVLRRVRLHRAQSSNVKLSNMRDRENITLGARQYLGLSLLAAYAVVQILLPLRHYAYPGDVLWNERGMRFSWKVLVREKNGSITYAVRSPRLGRTWQVSPQRYLTWRQFSEMSGQPDLIWQLARHIKRDFDQRGLGPVEVRSEAWVSLNGRRPSLLINPQVDLSAIKSSADLAPWILKEPGVQPIQIRSRRGA